jgi:hypothetical protein
MGGRADILNLLRGMIKRSSPSI